MAETAENVRVTRARFEQIFESISFAMKAAAEQENRSIASSEAERFGLLSTVPSRPPGEAWQTTKSGLTVWFQWRYYDQSGPFSLQKDMNILSLELREGDNVVRRAEERFED
jgi:hypothetical protein